MLHFADSETLYGITFPQRIEFNVHSPFGQHKCLAHELKCESFQQLFGHLRPHKPEKESKTKY